MAPRHFRLYLSCVYDMTLLYESEEKNAKNRSLITGVYVLKSLFPVGFRTRTMHLVLSWGKETIPSQQSGNKREIVSTFQYKNYSGTYIKYKVIGRNEGVDSVWVLREVFGLQPPQEITAILSWQQDL